MNRRHPRHTGVYQRCQDSCPADRCKRHKWGYWVGFPGPDSKTQQITKGGFPTAQAAADARAEVIQLHRTVDALPEGMKMTLGQYLPQWLADKIARGELRDSSATYYRAFIERYLTPRLGSRRLAELQPPMISRVYLDLVNQNGLNPSSVHQIHSVLSSALAAAEQDGLVTRNVARLAKLPKQNRKRVKPWNPEELGRFLDLIEGERLYPLFVLAAFSGLRRGELLGLRWADIDLDMGRLVVGVQRVSVGGAVVERAPKTEAGEGRPVWLDEATVAVLRAWRRQQAKERLQWGGSYHHDDYVFTRENGEPLYPVWVSHRFQDLVRRHKMRPTRFHDLRHFRASALINTGADIALVSKMMGHATIATTADIYGHLFDKTSRDMSERAAALVPRARRDTSA